MKLSFTATTIFTAGFLLLFAISCQQINKGESKSGWQLKPPGTAAEYGSPFSEPAAPEKPHKTEPPIQDKNGESTKQPATGGGEPESSLPALRIAPPPPAAGYGTPPPETGSPETTAPVPPAEPGSPDASHPADSDKSEVRQPEAGGHRPAFSPSWKIVPPPSAAGYGK